MDEDTRVAAIYHGSHPEAHGRCLATIDGEASARFGEPRFRAVLSDGPFKGETLRQIRPQSITFLT